MDETETNCFVRLRAHGHPVVEREYNIENKRGCVEILRMTECWRESLDEENKLSKHKNK